MNASLSRIFIGIGIVIFGIALLVSNLGVYDFGPLLSNWWPLVIIALGIVMFLNDTRHYLWSLIVTFFGVLLLLRELNIIEVNPWQLLWPAVVILLGVSLLMKRPHGTGKAKTVVGRDDVTAILGGSDRRVASDDYEGGKVTAILGGVKLDLRKAKITKEATVEVFTFWGGVELVVPRNVIVKNQTSAILGGVEDKTDQDEVKKAPVLYVVGDVVMGGVEIKN